MDEFDIKFKSRTTTKGKILADFKAEFTSNLELETILEKHGFIPDLPIWKFFVDGASNSYGSGTDIILISPEGNHLEYALRFEFKVSNNEVEYKALIARLRLAHSMEAHQLLIHIDS